MAMRSTKAVVRADMARFERDRDQSALSSRTVREWLTALLARYEAWLTHLSPP
jgi:hypothetical protein